jgi:hypothetical protein
VILYTSDKKEIIHYADGLLHDAFLFLIAGIVCAVFGLIYEIFSHEVYSFYMIYAFLIPLLPGALLNLVIAWLAVRKEKHLRIKEAAAFAENTSADLLNIGDADARSTVNSAFAENTSADLPDIGDADARNIRDAAYEDEEEACYELSNAAESSVSTGVFFPGRLTRRAWYSGLAALTVGSIFKGVLDIYGTTNKLIAVYPVVAAMLICAAVFSFSMSYVTIRKMHKKAEMSAI